MMKMLIRWLACLSTIALVSCGSSSTDPTAEPEREPDDTIDLSGTSTDLPDMPPLYILDLTRAQDGTVSVKQVDYISGLADTYRPIGSLSGDYLALGFTGDVLVDAVPVHFPENYLAESFDENLEYLDSSSGSLDNVFTRVSVDATQALDRIDIVDRSMNTVASVDNLPAAVDLTGRSTRPFSNYPWIDLMDESDLEQWQNQQNDVFSVVGLNTSELAQVEQVLDLMPRRLVSAIDSLGFGTLSTSGLTMGGYVLIDQKLLNLRPGYLFHILAHEAGHAYHNASADVGGETNYPEWLGSWPAQTRQQIALTHKQFGFDRDLLTFWAKLQSEAVSSGTASAYTNDRSASLPDAHRQGFVTAYAGSNIYDDIADTVAIANMNLTRSLSPELSSIACTYYQGTPELSREDALAYLKIRVVEALGLAESAEVDWCLGDASPTLVPGIQLGDALLFDRELKAGYTSAAKTGFNVIGQDAAGRGLAIELTTDGKPPLGVYPLDTTWWGSWDGSNTLVIASPVDIEARTGWSGTVVITYAKSGDRVDGFVLDLALASALGPASEFPYVPFRIPLD